jgi:ParB family chromosome partitioning protein
MFQNEQIVELPLDVVERGFYQPRDYFDAEAMEATKRSIQEKGQKYPVVVRPILAGNPLYDPAWTGTHYELADGERRFRCCKELGFSHIKALIRSLGDEEMLDYTLTTNDSLPLNPIEKAMVFSRLAKEFGKSQAEIARSFNLKQQQVSEYIRLLDLPAEIQDLTARAVISVRHARELLKLQDHGHMQALAKEVQEKSLSTRQLTKKLKENKDKSGIRPDKIKESDIIFENNGIKGDISSENSIYLVSDSSNLIKLPVPRPTSRPKKDYAGHTGPLNSLERLHFHLIPASIHEKMQYWLSFELGSGLSPETWLLRLEIAVLCGMLVALAAIWLPGLVLATLCGALFTLLVFVFIG